MRLRRAPQKIQLWAPGTGADPVYSLQRTVFGLVSVVSAEERTYAWISENSIKLSARVEDFNGDPPIDTGWRILVDSPAQLAGWYAVMGVWPYEGHLRLLCQTSSIPSGAGA